MQMVIAIIKPHMIDKLARALRKKKFSGYLAHHVKESGRHLEESGDYFDDRIKFELVVLEEQVEMVIGVILDTAGTNQEGDGFIFVTPVIEVVNIETRARGKAALLD